MLGVAPLIGTGTRPRERSPSRADNPERSAGLGKLIGADQSRATSMAIRSKIVPPRKGVKRPRGPLDADENPTSSKRRPAPRGGTKRKRDDDEDEANPRVRRPPPKPQGRLNAKKPKPKPPPDVVIKTAGPKPPPPPPPAAGMVGKTPRKGKR